jgi:hypothetical protein
MIRNRPDQPVPFKAAGKAKTPDPAISPARNMAAVIIPNLFVGSKSGIKFSVSILFMFTAFQVSLSMKFTVTHQLQS